MPSIPKLTQVQVALLCALKGGEMWGRDVRATLKADGYWASSAAFYDLVNRLELSGLLESRTEERDVLGQKFVERRYQLTRVGTEALDEAVAYYAFKFKLRPQEG
jgi:DNA-binding PadR family transcriptional regulator